MGMEEALGVWCGVERGVEETDESPTLPSICTSIASARLALMITSSFMDVATRRTTSSTPPRAANFRCSCGICPWLRHLRRERSESEQSERASACLCWRGRDMGDGWEEERSINGGGRAEGSWGERQKHDRRQQPLSQAGMRACHRVQGQTQCTAASQWDHRVPQGSPMVRGGCTHKLAHKRTCQQTRRMSRPRDPASCPPGFAQCNRRFGL